MSIIKIVVCDNQQKAQTEAALLQNDGFQTNEPRQANIVIWDTTPADGNASSNTDVRQNVWIVDGEK